MPQNPKWFAVPPTTLDGRYELSRVLASGENAVTYAAFDRALNRQIVVKAMNPVYASRGLKDTNTFRLFRARGFRHANIVAVDDVVVKDDRLYLTKEPVVALDLRTLLRLRLENQEPFTKKELVNLTSQICEALRWVHMLGSAGSLKPENILVDETSVRIDDPYFLVGPVSAAASQYLAPEQFSDPRTERKESDIFALTLIMGEILAGKPLKPGVPLSDQGPFFSPELDELYLRGTASEPEQRFDNVTELWEALSKVFRIGPEAQGAALCLIPQNLLGTWRQHSLLGRQETAAPLPVEPQPVSDEEEQKILARDSKQPAPVPQEEPEEIRHLEAPEKPKEAYPVDEEGAGGTIRIGVGAIPKDVLEPTAGEVAKEAAEPEMPAPQAPQEDEIRKIIRESGDMIVELELEEAPELPDGDLGKEISEEMARSTEETKPGDEGTLAPAPREVTAEEVELVEGHPAADNFDDSGLIIIGEAEDAREPDGHADTDLIIIGEEIRKKPPIPVPDVVVKGRGESANTSPKGKDKGKNKGNKGKDKADPKAEIKAEPALAQRTDSKTAPAASASAAAAPAKKKGGGGALWVVLLVLVLAGGGGGAWWAFSTGLIGGPSQAELDAKAAAQQQQAAAAEAARKAEEDRVKAEQARVEAQRKADEDKKAAEAQAAEALRVAKTAATDTVVRLGSALGMLKGTVTALGTLEGLDDEGRKTVEALVVRQQTLSSDLDAAGKGLSSAADAAAMEPVLAALKQLEEGIGQVEAAAKAFQEQRLQKAQEAAKALAAADPAGRLKLVDDQKLEGWAGVLKAKLEAAGDFAEGKALAAALATALTPFQEARKAVDAAAPEAKLAALDALESAAGTLKTAVDGARKALDDKQTGDLKAGLEALTSGLKKLPQKVEAWKASANPELEGEVKILADQEKESTDLLKVASELGLNGATTLEDWTAAFDKRGDVVGKVSRQGQVLAYLLRKSTEAKKDKTLALAEKDLKALEMTADALALKVAAKSAEWASAGNQEKAGELDALKAQVASISDRVTATLGKLDSIDPAEAKSQAAKLKADLNKASAKAGALLKQKVVKPDPAEKAAEGAKAELESKGCPAGMKKLVVKNPAAAKDKSQPAMLGYCIDYYEYPGKGQKPRTNVSFQAARAACAAIGKRLCSSSEWSIACGPKYPYGKDYSPDKCNTVDEEGLERPVLPAGSKAECRSPSGLYDMVGNVAEWTADETVNGGDSVKTAEDATCSRGVKRFGAARSVGFRCCADPK
jgi:serine/threonine protein kinase